MFEVLSTESIVFLWIGLWMVLIILNLSWLSYFMTRNIISKTSTVGMWFLSFIPVLNILTFIEFGLLYIITKMSKK